MLPPPLRHHEDGTEGLESARLRKEESGGQEDARSARLRKEESGGQEDARKQKGGGRGAWDREAERRRQEEDN